MLLIVLLCSFLNRMASRNGERRLVATKTSMILLMVGNFLFFLSSFNREVEFFDMVKTLPQATITTRRLIADIASDPHDRGESSFSSCLMVRDNDNAKLIEWIAYHYFTMPLRYLVVLQDPASQISSKEVLQRWNPFMNIVEWNDGNLVDIDAKNQFSRKENEEEHEFQLRRQAAFHHRCAMHMQQNERAMVSFHDVNEYAAINEDVVRNAAMLIQQPGSVLRLLHHAYSSEPTSKPIPCVTTYRTQFSAIESTKELVKKNVPEFLNADHFDTLTWRYHIRLNETNQIGKSFVDVSSIPDLNTLSASQQGSVRGRYEFSPSCPPSLHRQSARFRIHHYPLAGDKIPTKSLKASGRDVENDEVRPWIWAFVDLFGKETAQSLLQDVGTLGAISEKTENEVAAARMQ